MQSNPSTRFVRSDTPAYILVFIRDYPVIVGLEDQNKLHVQLSDAPSTQHASAAIIAQTSKLSHSHFHFEHRILAPPSELRLFLECLPESPTVPLEIKHEPTIL